MSIYLRRITSLILLLTVMSLIVVPVFAQEEDCLSDRTAFPASPDGSVGEILFPANCQTVEAGVAVSSTGTATLESDFHLWLFVWVNGRYYPQWEDANLEPEICEPEASMLDGAEWETDTYFGTLDDTGEQFDAVLVMVDDTLHQFLIDEWMNAENNPETPCTAQDGFLPEELPAGEIYELDAVTVILSDGDGTPDTCSYTLAADTEIIVEEDSGEYGAALITYTGAVDSIELDVEDISFFGTAPSIDLDGNLMFSTTAEQYGTTTVNVSVFAGEVECEPTDASSFTITVLPVNDPPVCDAATAAPAILWPPNHQMEAITIGGITDVDSSIFFFTIDSIESNEPVNDVGDGNTAPDWDVVSSTLETGEETQNALLRAERSGTGDGRMYTINFTVDDADFLSELGDEFTTDDIVDGGTCSGTLSVFVPHDMGQDLTNADALLPEAPVEDTDTTITDVVVSVGMSAMNIYLDDDNGSDDEPVVATTSQRSTQVETPEPPPTKTPKE